MLEQKGDGMVNRFGINQVVVVEDEDEIIGNGCDFIEQGCQNHFGWRRLRGLEHRQQPCAHIRLNRLHGSDEVRQEACGVVIPFVQRQPGRLSLAVSDPCADERALAKAGSRRDERQFALHTIVEPLDEPGAVNKFRLRRGDIKFGG